jgi:hypothetical protein
MIRSIVTLYLLIRFGGRQLIKPDLRISCKLFKVVRVMARQARFFDADFKESCRNVSSQGRIDVSRGFGEGCGQ